MFLEGYRKQNYPPTSIVYPFLFSTQLIADLRTLHLDGNGELLLWENRRKGFSLFAFAPLEAGSQGNTRSRMSGERIREGDQALPSSITVGTEQTGTVQQ
jgi:hypothetical protein